MFQATLDYHSNGQNSVVEITQEAITGDTIQSLKTFDPWGVPYASSSNAPSPLEPSWQGRERDETGLSYFRARYYDAGGVTDSTSLIGHFISRDPAGFSAGINVYAFGGNDPLNMADPSGMTATVQGCQVGSVRP